MNRAFLPLAVILTFTCCGPIATDEGSDSRRILLNPVRIEIYLYEATADNNCTKHLEGVHPPSDLSPNIVRHSWADFENHGFAKLQIDHIPASKKMLVFVVAIDPNTNEILGNACADNVEVERGALRDVHLVLNSTSGLGDKE